MPIRIVRLGTARVAGDVLRAQRRALHLDDLAREHAELLVREGRVVQVHGRSRCAFGDRAAGRVQIGLQRRCRRLQLRDEAHAAAQFQHGQRERAGNGSGKAEREPDPSIIERRTRMCRAITKQPRSRACASCRRGTPRSTAFSSPTRIEPLPTARLARPQPRLGEAEQASTCEGQRALAAPRQRTQHEHAGPDDNASRHA